ncbi:MAG: CoA transferase [Alphaproteobacteria bacterium]|nr:CoA transferase [Alphaproteobacteria bacterium]
MTAAPGPMDGVRVLDLATFLATPFAAAILGEFGAEVIKVEQPGGGDPTRQFGTATDIPDSSLAWLSEARNKHSITLNLKHPDGADLFKRLVRDTDVVCENFRPGTLQKWGLGYDTLHAINPRLVMLQVTGYGQDGPYRERPGFARIAHAVGGLTYLAGMPGEAPVTPGSTSLADYISGLFGAVGVLMALRTAERTGQGQTVDVALFESIFRVLDELAPAYGRHGTVREREGLGTRNVCPHGHFPTKDGGWVAIACTSDKIWARMARNVLDRPDLAASHPTTALRVGDRALIDGVVNGFTTAHSSAEIVAICEQGEVPCAPINSIADIFADPHFDARGTLQRIQHALLGEVVVPDVLPRLSGTPGAIKDLGPRLGDWNDLVYGERLGLAPGERDELKKRGVI